MTARLISNNGTREVSDREFYTSVFGHPPLTQAERLAEHQTKVERYIAVILRGNEWAVPPPYVAECRRIIAEREAAECGPDPLRHLEPRARRVA